MKKKIGFGLILSMSFVVTGNMLGAGILALPIKTGLSGLWPSIFGIILMWICMLSTACILAGQESLMRSDTADLPTFFQHELGTAGKWVSVVANIIILYGLLVAYISGAADVMDSLFPIPHWILETVFFVVASFLSLFGMALMRRGNALIMILMWITFAALVVICAEQVKTSRMSYTDWSFLPSTLPIVVTAFHFHNIIPTIARSMNFDQKAIRTSFALGTGIGLVMNIIWVVVVIGALPLGGPGGDTILSAYHNNVPATVPLSHLIKTPMFMTCSLVFALLAMTAAYMANGTALSSFIRDLCSTYLKTNNKTLASVLTFFPPLMIALAFPHVFLKAIGLVGGVGIDIIFGILPGVLLIKYKSGFLRYFGWFLVIVFAIVLIYELGAETHILNTHPRADYFDH